jgi:hypothetical protein
MDMPNASQWPGPKVVLEDYVGLEYREATPMRRLAQQLDYDASNLTTLVDRLAARGALERQADFADRRVCPRAHPRR